MSSGVNLHILVGNIGNDPEDLRYTPKGTPVLNISLATNRSYKDKQTGDMVENVDWHRLVLFNKLAELVKQYCIKGSQMYFQGESRTRSYVDENSVKRYVTEVVVNEMRFLGGGKKNSADSVLEQGGTIQDNLSDDNAFDEYSANAK